MRETNFTRSFAFSNFIGMRRWVLGLGSNLGNRLETLESCLKLLDQRVGDLVNTSFLYESKAFQPRFPQPRYLIAACEVRSSLDLKVLHQHLLDIENIFGQRAKNSGDARHLDIDILLGFDSHGKLLTVDSDDLTIPHKEMGKRDFVRDPLADILGDSFAFPEVPGETISSNGLRRVLPMGDQLLDFPIVGASPEMPKLMGILNVTPDSFSGDGFQPTNTQWMDSYLSQDGLTLVDVGGESTRPGHTVVSPKTEISRVKSVLDYLKSKFPGVPLSLDSRNRTTLEALAPSYDLINDVSFNHQNPGFEGGGLLDFVKSSGKTYLVCHSAPEGSDVDALTTARELGDLLVTCMQTYKIPRWRLMADFGFGFGKTVPVCIDLLRNPKYRSYIPRGIPLCHAFSKKRMTRIDPKSGEPTDMLKKNLEFSEIAYETSTEFLRVHDVSLIYKHLQQFGRTFPG